MFDSATAALLRSAPSVPGLDPDNIPALLTSHYANLSAARLAGSSEGMEQLDPHWPLERIADTYELASALLEDPALRRASAFVAGTAHQIIGRQQRAEGEEDSSPIDRDFLHPSLAAAVLFLAAEQYADANQAADAISAASGIYEARILAENIGDLARGHLSSILGRADRWRRDARYDDIEDLALAGLLEATISGIELLAAQLLCAKGL